MRGPRSTASGTELDLDHDMAAQASVVENWTHNLCSAERALLNLKEPSRRLAVVTLI